MKKERLSLKKVLLIEAVLLGLICACLFQIEASATSEISRQSILQKVDYIESTTEEYSSLMDTVIEKEMFYRKGVANFLAYLDNHVEEFNPQTTPNILFPNEEILVNQNKSDDAKYITSKSDNGTEYAVKESDDSNNYSDLEAQTIEAIEDIIEKEDLFLMVNQEGDVEFSTHADYFWKNITDLGIEMDDIPLEDAGWIAIDGQKYYVASKQGSNDTMRFIVGLKSQTININNRIAGLLICAAIWIISILIITYYYFLRQERSVNEDNENDQDVLKKTYSNPWILCVLGVVVIGVVTYHVQSLFGLSVYSMHKNDEAAHLQSKSELLVENYVGEAIFTTNYEVNKAYAVNSAYNMYPELRNSASLREICDLLDLEFIEQRDMDGNVLVTSALYKNQYDEWSTDSIFSEYEDYFATGQDIKMLDQSLTFLEETPILENGEITSRLTAGIKKDSFKAFENKMTVKDFLSGVPIQEGNEIICIDSETKDVLYASNDDYIGTSALSLGIPETALNNESYLSFNLQGKKYYSTSMTMDKYVVLLLSPSRSLFSGRLEITMATMGMCALVFLGLILLISRQEPELPESVTEENQNSQGKANLIERMRQEVNWASKSAEEKAMFIARSIYHVLSLLVIVTALFRNTLYDNNTIFGFIINAKWEKGINIFAITTVIIIVFVYSVVMNIVRYVFKKLISIVNPKSETFLRLFRSFLIYGSMLVLIFYCMELLGFDSGSLIASAGLMGFVISWGAKDMITDILAGLFIIFENQFQVGDAIEVDGQRGNVLEIGVRTTKLMTLSGDTRIVSNRNLTNIINKSRYPSNGSIIIQIGYDQDLKAIDAMLKEEIPKLKDMDPHLLSGPNYAGILECGEKTIQLLIGFRSEENYKFGITTQLWAKVYDLFEQYGFEMGVNPKDITITKEEKSSQ